MLLIGLKLLTLVNLILSARGYKQCQKYTSAVLGENAAAAPVVVKALAVRSIPEYLNVTDSRYFGYQYDAEIWLISVYKGHEQVARFLNMTDYDDTTLYSIKDRRVNLTGFFKPQDGYQEGFGYEKSRCWQKVTTAKYYFMFLELKQGLLSAYQDDERGAFTPWSADNVTVVWNALGWSDWSDWAICSAKCGGGTQERWRYCERGGDCSGWNKERRSCNDFPCDGVVDPLELKSEDYFHPLRRQWERVPGRETAWHLKRDSYVWLPGNQVAFPKVNFQGSCSLLISLRVHANGQQQGTILSLKSRRQKNVYLSVELYDSKFIRLVHSNSNNTVRSIVIPTLVGDGKWHQIAIGILDENRIHSYVDCEWVYNYVLPRESLNTPEDADLVIGYLFTGDIEQLLLVPNADAIKHQCNESASQFLDRTFLNATKQTFPPTKIPPELSNIDRVITSPPPATDDTMDQFVLTSYLTKRHSISNKTSGQKDEPNYLSSSDETMMGDQPDEKTPAEVDKDDGVLVAISIGALEQVTPAPVSSQHEESGETTASSVPEDESDWRVDDEPDEEEREDGSGIEDAVMYEVEWSIWSHCSVSCGGGVRTRHSRCVDTNVKKLELCLQSGDERVESRACNTHACPSKSHVTRKNMVLSLLENHNDGKDSVESNAIISCPCLNGGSCMNFEPKSVWPYLKVELRRKCQCAAGYTGELCATPICTEPCANGGICIRPDVCYCSKLYSGDTCETPMCIPPCQNDGECVEPGVCSCKSGFGHPRCTPICPGGCGEHGVCTAPGKCTCHPGYHGLLCGERARCTRVCANGGVCERENVCRCRADWTGVDCSTPICEPPCVNEGVCVAPNRCSCPSETLGPNCNLTRCTPGADCSSRICTQNTSSPAQCEEVTCTPPCLNGATCASNNVCVCSDVTTGHRCETKKCDVRPVQEPFTRGFRRVAKSHNKCRFNNLRLCVKQFPHYETVYKTYYQTRFRCIEEWPGIQ